MEIMESEKKMSKKERRKGEMVNSSQETYLNSNFQTLPNNITIFTNFKYLKSMTNFPLLNIQIYS